MTIKTTLALGLALSGLTACSGGSNPADPSDDLPDIATSAYNLIVASEGAELAVEPPTTAEATYEGYAIYRYASPSVIVVVDDADMLSRMSLAIDFGDLSISGRAYDFESADGDPISGELTIVERETGWDSFQNFGGHMTGELTEDGSSTPYDFDIYGNFLDDEEVLRGAIEGNDLSNGFYVGGSFITELQP